MVAEPSFLHTYPSHPAPNSYPPYQSPTVYTSHPPYPPPRHFQDPQVHHPSYNQLWKQPPPTIQSQNQSYNPHTYRSTQIDRGNIREPEGIGVSQAPSSNQPWIQPFQQDCVGNSPSPPVESMVTVQDSFAQQMQAINARMDLLRTERKLRDEALQKVMVALLEARTPPDPPPPINSNHVTAETLVHPPSPFIQVTNPSFIPNLSPQPMNFMSQPDLSRSQPPVPTSQFPVVNQTTLPYSQPIPQQQQYYTNQNNQFYNPNLNQPNTQLNHQQHGGMNHTGGNYMNTGPQGYELGNQFQRVFNQESQAVPEQSTLHGEGSKNPELGEGKPVEEYRGSFAKIMRALGIPLQQEITSPYLSGSGSESSLHQGVTLKAADDSQKVLLVADQQRTSPVSLVTWKSESSHQKGFSSIPPIDTLVNYLSSMNQPLQYENESHLQPFGLLTEPANGVNETVDLEPTTKALCVSSHKACTDAGNDIVVEEPARKYCMQTVKTSEVEDKFEDCLALGSLRAIMEKTQDAVLGLGISTVDVESQKIGVPVSMLANQKRTSLSLVGLKSELSQQKKQPHDIKFSPLKSKDDTSMKNQLLSSPSPFENSQSLGITEESQQEISAYDSGVFESHRVIRDTLSCSEPRCRTFIITKPQKKIEKGRKLKKEPKEKYKAEFNRSMEKRWYENLVWLVSPTQESSRNAIAEITTLGGKNLVLFAQLTQENRATPSLAGVTAVIAEESHFPDLLKDYKEKYKEQCSRSIGHDWFKNFVLVDSPGQKHVRKHSSNEMEEKSSRVRNNTFGVEGIHHRSVPFNCKEIEKNIEKKGEFQVNPLAVTEMVSSLKDTGQQSVFPTTTITTNAEHEWMGREPKNDSSMKTQTKVAVAKNFNQGSHESIKILTYLQNQRSVGAGQQKQAVLSSYEVVCDL